MQTPHSHDNNPTPPDHDLTLTLVRPNGTRHTITAEALRREYPTAEIPAYGYTTDHGRHGPYHLRGVALLTLIQQEVAEAWTAVVVLSADGFGNQLTAAELQNPDPAGPVLLCYESDGRPLGREQRTIRLVVPSETDNALRQVKWVREVRVVSAEC